MISKALIYRVWSIFITAIVVYFLTADFAMTTIFTILLEIIKTLNYMLFEYIWNHFKEKRK